MKVTIKDSYKVAIETKYLGPTNTKGARIKAFTESASITKNYDHSLTSFDNKAEAARALCEKLGWEGHLVGGGTKTGEAFVFVD